MNAFAALAEPAARDFLRQHTFRDTTFRRCGHYRVRLFVSSVDGSSGPSRPRNPFRAREITVDDQFPASSTAAKTAAVPLFVGPATAASSRADNGVSTAADVKMARVVGNEVWAMVLEKALAKIHGSYAALRRLSVSANE